MRDSKVRVRTTWPPRIAAAAGRRRQRSALVARARLASAGPLSCAPPGGRRLEVGRARRRMERRARAARTRAPLPLRGTDVAGGVTVARGSPGAGGLAYRDQVSRAASVGASAGDGSSGAGASGRDERLPVPAGVMKAMTSVAGGAAPAGRGAGAVCGRSSSAAPAAGRCRRGRSSSGCT